jgi:DNA polymerase III subunit epsilon
VSAPGLALDGVRFERDGLLVRTALDLLAASPASTPEVASRVLGIRQANGAAAAAVFALLGTDPRFSVTGEGVWSLAAPSPPPLATPEQLALPLRPLRDEEWVVVDLETTGGSPLRGHRVTEFAAVRVSGGRITETYATLVNPARAIPRFVTSLTGITEAMVAAAPHFHEIATRVSDAIGGRVFVAHNAAFDWRFLAQEMRQATGTSPVGRQLCTVKLARKLIPELPSRGLDALAMYFGVEIEHRHRALDDAVATAKVLIRLLDILEDRGAADWEALELVLKRRARRKRKRRSTLTSMESAW